MSIFIHIYIKPHHTVHNSCPFHTCVTVSDLTDVVVYTTGSPPLALQLILCMLMLILSMYECLYECICAFECESRLMHGIMFIPDAYRKLSS